MDMFIILIVVVTSLVCVRTYTAPVKNILVSKREEIILEIPDPCLGNPANFFWSCTSIFLEHPIPGNSSVSSTVL